MCAKCTSHGYYLRVVFILLRAFNCVATSYPRVASDQGNTVYMCVITIVLYSGKLLRKKTFMNFEVLLSFLKFCDYLAKVFSMKFGGVALFGTNSEQSTVFATKILLKFPPIHKSFLSRKFPATLYQEMEAGLAQLSKPLAVVELLLSSPMKLVEY